MELSQGTYVSTKGPSRPLACRRWASGAAGPVGQYLQHRRLVMHHGRLAVAVALGLLLAGARAAPAVRVHGGGPPKTDCYAEFEVEKGTLAGRTTVECMDGAACDTDGACDGNCSFRLAVCFNQTDISNCTPAPPTCLMQEHGELIVPRCSANADC